MASSEPSHDVHTRVCIPHQARVNKGESRVSSVDYSSIEYGMCMVQYRPYLVLKHVPGIILRVL